MAATQRNTPDTVLEAGIFYVPACGQPVFFIYFTQTY